MSENIGLHELLNQVKSELLSQSVADPGPLFYVEGVELELSFTARKEGEAGVALYIVEVGASANREQVQKVHVSLKPLYSREELRHLMEQDPVTGPKLRQLALRGAVKGELFHE